LGYFSAHTISAHTSYLKINSENYDEIGQVPIGAAIAKLLEDQPCHQEEDLMAEIPSIYVSKEHIPLNPANIHKVKTMGLKSFCRSKGKFREFVTNSCIV